jgi:hypothetical protein
MTDTVGDKAEERNFQAFSEIFEEKFMEKRIILAAGLTAAAVLAGCGSIPQGAERINMITQAEAKANSCQLLDKAGSVSAVMINGYKRNTQVAVTKALRVPGATHVGYTKGKPGTTNVRMFVWKCPNPNLRTKDPQVAAWQKEYLGH